MNTIDLIFIVHDTLTLDHVEISLKSISTVEWNSVYIYNSCSYIKTYQILELIENYNIKHQDIIVLNISPKKTLTSDLFHIRNQYSNMHKADYIFLLKADYSISKNLSEFILSQLDGSEFLYSLPTINAKEFASDLDICDLLTLEKFPYITDEMCYRGSDYHQPKCELNSALGFNDSDSSVKYVSWAGSLDYNVHLMKSNLISYFSDDNLDENWGGVSAFKNIERNGHKIIQDLSVFCVHKYHGIISDNNKTDRRDVRKLVDNNRY